MSNIMCKSCGKNATIVNKVITNDIGKAIVMVKNVPTVVCKHCGETGYFSNVSDDVIRLVDIVKGNAHGVVLLDYNDRENFFNSIEAENTTEVIL